MAEYKSRHTGEEIDKAVEEVSTKVPLDSGVAGINVGAMLQGDVGNGMIKINIPTQGFSGTFYIEMQGMIYGNGPYHFFDLRIGLNVLADNTIRLVNALLISNTKAISKVTAGFDSVNNNLCVLVHSATNRFQYTRANIGRVTLRSSGGNIPKLSNWKMEYVADMSGITNIAETPVNWVVTDDGVWYDLVLENGATAGNNRPQYRKVGNVVFLRGSVTPNSTGMIGFATLPVGFRAPWNTTKVITQSSSITSALRTRMLFTSGSGVLYLGVYPDVVTNFEITCSFIADQ